MFAVLPIALVCFSLFACYLYPITPELHNRLKAYLDRKRAGEEWPGMEEEAFYLKEKLH
jgi:Na+/melibiose symporter-like transporter